MCQDEMKNPFDGALRLLFSSGILIYMLFALAFMMLEPWQGTKCFKDLQSQVLSAADLGPMCGDMHFLGWELRRQHAQRDGDC